MLGSLVNKFLESEVADRLIGAFVGVPVESDDATLDNALTKLQGNAIKAIKLGARQALRRRVVSQLVNESIGQRTAAEVVAYADRIVKELEAIEDKENAEAGSPLAIVTDGAMQ